MTVIFAQLLGGIGNLLFIIANIYSLSIDRKYDFCVTNFTQSCTKRKDETEWLNTIFKYIKKVNNRPTNIRLLYKEKTFKYQKIPDTNNNSFEVYGYFQSDKYFKHNKEKIIELFTLYKKEIQTDLDKIFNNEKNTISIHIRRGDYLKLQHAHIVQSLDYYEKALKRLSIELKYNNIVEMNKIYKILIFSDDIDWCKEQKLFKSLKNIKYMSKNSTIIDLYLMSMCDHHIIANSTFSWWSSYLNTKKNKKVIAPSKWFNVSYMKEEEWQDIYTENMIVI